MLQGIAKEAAVVRMRWSAQRLHAGCGCQVRTASCGAANCVNTFGDEQLAVDLLADKLLFEALKFSVGPPTCACSLARQ